MKQPHEITLRFHVNGFFILDSEPGASSNMGPLKKRFELLLCLRQRAASLPAGNQDCE